MSNTIGKKEALDAIRYELRIIEDVAANQARQISITAARERGNGDMGPTIRMGHAQDMLMGANRLARAVGVDLGRPGVGDGKFTTQAVAWCNQEAQRRAEIIVRRKLTEALAEIDDAARARFGSDVLPHVCRIPSDNNTAAIAAICVALPGEVEINLSDIANVASAWIKGRDKRALLEPDNIKTDRCRFEDLSVGDRIVASGQQAPTGLYGGASSVWKVVEMRDGYVPPDNGMLYLDFECVLGPQEGILRVASGLSGDIATMVERVTDDGSRR